jgi:hypothetical protein
MQPLTGFRGMTGAVPDQRWGWSGRCGASGGGARVEQGGEVHGSSAVVGGWMAVRQAVVAGEAVGGFSSEVEKKVRVNVMRVKFFLIKNIY